jgi:tetratricopeptide (TPR) repeat protein
VRAARPVLAAVALALALCFGVSGTARAEWLQPDPSFRDAVQQLREATRDTVGHGSDATALDSLGVALLRLARTGDAATIFHRVLVLRPGDDTAEAGLGKLALFANRIPEAESLLTQAGTAGDEAIVDLYSARLRAGEWSKAADLAEQANDAGRVEMLRYLAENPPYRVTGERTETSIVWSKAYPVPLVRVKLNGQSVLMAIDLGCGDLLIDPMWASRGKITMLSGESVVFWCGSRIAVKNAVLQRLELNGLKIENLPAGVVSLHKWSLEVNPQSEQVAGVIGINLMRRFTTSLDYRRQRLELRPRSLDAQTVAPQPMRVPFEMWGENEVMVRGTVGSSRKLALVLDTGIPGCALAAPGEVFEELGVKGGSIAKLIKGAGTWLNGRPWVPATVPVMSIGPLARSRLPGWGDAFDSSEMWRHGVRRDGAVSGEFFRGLRITPDWDRQVLLFEQKK